MVLEKKPLGFADIEAQTALELPDRETPTTVIIGCLAVCGGQIRIQNVDVTVAAQICADVDVLNNSLIALTGATTDVLSCTIKGH